MGPIPFSGQFLIFAHPDDVDAANMTARRAGVEYRTGGPPPKYDFIPSALMPAWISAERSTALCPRPNTTASRSMAVYAGALLIQSPFVPKAGLLS